MRATPVNNAAPEVSTWLAMFNSETVLTPDHEDVFYEARRGAHPEGNAT